MGLVKNNDLTEGISGRVGEKLVFRQLGKRTIASKRPPKRTVLTEKQLNHRQRFAAGTLYASKALADPATKADYVLMAKEVENSNAFAAALGDYLKAPVINTVNLDAYKGNVGDVIHVQVKSAMKIVAMKVTLTAADGTVIETGDATHEVGKLFWNYTTTKSNAAPPGTKVHIVATDRPGNTTTFDDVKK